LHQVPEEYACCFVALEQAGLIPGDLSCRLQQMARLRNLLVHVYWKIDYGQVYDILRHASTIFVRSVQPSPDWFNGSRPISANTTDSLCFR
jgi:uncharacterized protein YutE (UPF0331/DUF86 family)